MRTNKQIRVAKVYFPFRFQRLIFFEVFFSSLAHSRAFTFRVSPIKTALFLMFYQRTAQTMREVFERNLSLLNEWYNYIIVQKRILSIFLLTM